jgi:DNA replication ATP-dependent helicase Dna2
MIFLKVMNAKDYTLIQGLPGTGKTSILAFIARLLAARGKRVLITSYTHSSVDNVMLKLMEKGLASFDASTGLPRLIRVGQMSSCHRDVRPLVVSELAAQLDALVLGQNSCLSQPELSQDNPTAQSLKQVVSSAQIVCASALSVPRSPLLVNENFDVVIIDEAGQISQPAILGALMAADSFVLVGDHQQLPPLVNSEIAESGGKWKLVVFVSFSETKAHTCCSIAFRIRSFNAKKTGR